LDPVLRHVGPGQDDHGVAGLRRGLPRHRGDAAHAIGIHLNLLPLRRDAAMFTVPTEEERRYPRRSIEVRSPMPMIRPGSCRRVIGRPARPESARSA